MKTSLGELIVNEDRTISLRISIPNLGLPDPEHLNFLALGKYHDVDIKTEIASAISVEVDSYLKSLFSRICLDTLKEEVKLEIMKHLKGKTDAT